MFVTFPHNSFDCAWNFWKPNNFLETIPQTLRKSTSDELEPSVHEKKGLDVGMFTPSSGAYCPFLTISTPQLMVVLRRCRRRPVFGSYIPSLDTRHVWLHRFDCGAVCAHLCNKNLDYFICVRRGDLTLCYYCQHPPRDDVGMVKNNDLPCGQLAQPPQVDF